MTPRHLAVAGAVELERQQAGHAGAQRVPRADDAPAAGRAYICFSVMLSLICCSLGLFLICVQLHAAMFNGGPPGPRAASKTPDSFRRSEASSAHCTIRECAKKPVS